MMVRPPARSLGQAWPAARSIAALAGLLLVAATARATSMPPRTHEQVAAASELVVEATAITTRTAWVGGHIVTFTDLRVERVLRSRAPAPPSVLTVALPGGRLDGIAQRVAGAPELRAGERYLLCLSGEVLRGAHTVVGLWQGAWLLDRGAVRGFTHDGVATTASPRASLERALLGAP